MNDTMILQASLERIAISLERIARALEHSSVTPTPQVANTEAPDQPLNAPVIEPTAEPVQPEPVKVEEPEPPKPCVTIDQIRKLVVELSSKGAEKKDAVREVIMAYAPNVSGIPADKYPEVLDKLNALKEG